MMNDINQSNDTTNGKKENTNNDSVNPSIFDLENIGTGNQNIPLSINGIDHEEEQIKLKSQLQAMISAELKKYIESLKSNNSKDTPPDIADEITVSLESLPI